MVEMEIIKGDGILNMDNLEEILLCMPYKKLIGLGNDVNKSNELIFRLNNDFYKLILLSNNTKGKENYMLLIITKKGNQNLSKIKKYINQKLY